MLSDDDAFRLYRLRWQIELAFKRYKSLLGLKNIHKAKDPILFAGGDTNLYGYVLQNPVNLLDRDGLLPAPAAAAGPRVAVLALEAAGGSAWLGPVGWGAAALVAGWMLYDYLSEPEPYSGPRGGLMLPQGWGRGGIPPTPTSRMGSGLGDCPTPNPETERAIRSLRDRIAEHLRKLEEYRANPDAFDNQGFLRNAPSEAIRQRIIEGRIRHLEHEIETFRQNIIKLGGVP
jgi:hypothetical protein